MSGAPFLFYGTSQINPALGKIGYLSAKDYGVFGVSQGSSGTTDQSTALSAFLDTCNSLNMEAYLPYDSGGYNITTALATKSYSLRLHGDSVRGSIFNVSHTSGWTLNFAGSRSATVALASNPVTGATSVTVSSWGAVTPPVAGQTILIGDSTPIWPGASGQPLRYQGHQVEVEHVSGTTVTFREPLISNAGGYTSSPFLCVIGNLTDCVIDSIGFVGPYSNGSTQSTGFINLKYGQDVKVNLWGEGFGNQAFAFVHPFRVTGEIRGRNAPWNSGNNQYGYLAEAIGASNHVDLRVCGHSVGCTWQTSGVDNDYGYCANTRITGEAVNNSNSNFGTHEQTYRCVFDNCKVVGSSGSPFDMRGFGVTVQGYEIDDITPASSYGAFNIFGNPSKPRIGKGIVRNVGGTGSAVQVFALLGSTNTVVDRLEIDGMTLDHSRGGAPIVANAVTEFEMKNCTFRDWDASVSFYDHIARFSSTPATVRHRIHNNLFEVPGNGSTSGLFAYDAGSISSSSDLQIYDNYTPDGTPLLSSTSTYPGNTFVRAVPAVTPPNTPMFADSFESGDFSAWASTSGTPTVVTAQRRTGKYAMLVTVGSQYARTWNGPNITVGAAAYLRFYVRFTANPAQQVIIAYLENTAFGGAANVALNTDGTVSLLDSTSTIVGSKSAALNTGQWYRVELSVAVPSSGNGSAALKLNGATVALSPAVNVANTQIQNLRIGALNSGTITSSIYFDDVVIDTGYWVGP